MARIYDLFISHASEDKESFVRALVENLTQKGLSVWFDELTLTLGDSLRRSIDDGLANSRFGVVVLSPSFFSKEWPQKELDGLVTREVNGTKVILPVWHGITQEEILGYSPLLADRLGVQTSKGLGIVVEEILKVVRATPIGENVNKSNSTIAVPKEAEIDRIVDAIIQMRPNAASVTRKSLGQITVRLHEIATALLEELTPYKTFHQRTITAVPYFSDFARICSAVAEIGDTRSADEIRSSFCSILERHEPKMVGQYVVSRSEADFNRFVSHFLFTMFIALLLREKRFEILSAVLQEKFHVNYYGVGDASVGHGAVSRTVSCIAEEAQHQRIAPFVVRTSLIEEMLNRLSISLPVNLTEFSEADCFLFLRSVVESAQDNLEPSEIYCPWTSAGARDIPAFLRTAKSRTKLEEILPALGVDSVETLRNRFPRAASTLTKLFSFDFYVLNHPLKSFDQCELGAS